MKEMLNKFKTNFKKYFDYLMTVNFGELFINVLILLCILLLSTFVFIPVGLIESLIRDFIILFVTLPTIVLSIYSWIFNLISTVLTFLAFIYLFNKRFDDIEAFKKQLKEKPQVKEENDAKTSEEELELPKTKETK